MLFISLICFACCAYVIYVTFKLLNSLKFAFVYLFDCKYVCVCVCVLQLSRILNAKCNSRTERDAVCRWRGLNAIVIVFAVMYVNICFACEVALYAALICALCVVRGTRC